MALTGYPPPGVASIIYISKDGSSNTHFSFAANINHKAPPSKLQYYCFIFLYFPLIEFDFKKRHLIPR
jgi:hypothetical protein